MITIFPLIQNNVHCLHVIYYTLLNCMQLLYGDTYELYNMYNSDISHTYFEDAGRFLAEFLAMIPGILHNKNILLYSHMTNKSLFFIKHIWIQIKLWNNISSPFILSLYSYIIISRWYIGIYKYEHKTNPP